MRLQKIISILFIACFLNLEVFGTQGVVAVKASSLDLNNFASRLNILNDCLFNDIAEIEETELYENRKIRKSGRVLSSQQLFASISRLQSSYTVSYKSIRSASEFQHGCSRKRGFIILLL